MEGCWESIAKITKKYLTFINKDRPIHKDALVTFLVQVES